MLDSVTASERMSQRDEMHKFVREKEGKLGTIAQADRPSGETRMSAKAQEIALDKALVARFKAGDEAAFEEMVARYWDRIYAMVHKLLRNSQDAEEVTQDAFIRAHRGLEKFRGDSSFSTWLYQIATNLARNRYWYWWRRKRDKSVSFDQPVGGAESETTLGELFASDSATPKDVAITNEFQDRVTASMELLNDKHREVLVLRNVKNMTYDEIADLLQISIGTVKSRIARARESLREKLGREFL